MFIFTIEAKVKRRLGHNSILTMNVKSITMIDAIEKTKLKLHDDDSVENYTILSAKMIGYEIGNVNFKINE